MLPAIENAAVNAAIRRYEKESLGWKLSGTSGDGYFVLVAKRPIPGAIRLKVRRQVSHFSSLDGLSKPAQ